MKNTLMFIAFGSLALLMVGCAKASTVDASDGQAAVQMDGGNGTGSDAGMGGQSVGGAGGMAPSSTGTGGGGGGWVCTPTPETCDGADNDCNGLIDEGLDGQPCSVPGQQGACVVGQTHCQHASLLCEQVIMPSPEVCDGIDNNCDGQVDEGFNIGAPCGDPSLDYGPNSQCKQGTTTCAGCTGFIGPSAEDCSDGIDNDCNGLVDQADTQSCCTPGNTYICGKKCEPIVPTGQQCWDLTAVCADGSKHPC